MDAMVQAEVLLRLDAHLRVRDAAQRVDAEYAVCRLLAEALIVGDAQMRDECLSWVADAVPAAGGW